MPRAILVFRIPQEQDGHQVAVDGWRWRELVREMTQDWKYKGEMQAALEWLGSRLEEEGLTLWD